MKNEIASESNPLKAIRKQASKLKEVMETYKTIHELIERRNNSVTKIIPKQTQTAILQAGVDFRVLCFTHSKLYAKVKYFILSHIC